MQQEARALTSVDLRVTTNDAQDVLGAVGVTQDDRMYRYCQVGNAAVTSGTLLSTPATNTNYLGLSVSSPVSAGINSVEITVTLAGTAVTTDQFAQGSIEVISGTGAGTTYKVRGNTSQTSTTGQVQVFLNPGEPIAVALDTTSKINLCMSLWSGVTSQIAVGSSSDNPRLAGVANVPFSANQYGWIQAEGRCMCINDGQGPIYRGLTVVPSITTAGRVIQTNGTTDADKQVVGNAMEHSNATAGLFVPIYLTII